MEQQYQTLIIFSFFLKKKKDSHAHTKCYNDLDVQISITDGKYRRARLGALHVIGRLHKYRGCCCSVLNRMRQKNKTENTPTPPSVAGVWTVRARFARRPWDCGPKPTATSSSRPFERGLRVYVQTPAAQRCRWTFLSSFYFWHVKCNTVAAATAVALSSSSAGIQINAFSLYRTPPRFKCKLSCTAAISSFQGFRIQKRADILHHMRIYNHHFLKSEMTLNRISYRHNRWVKINMQII